MAKAKAKENKPIEFKFEGENGNTFNGRIYEGKESKNCTIYPLSITINGLAIVGAKLFVNDKMDFIKLPEYKGNDGEYHSICYFYDKADIKDLKECADELVKLIIE